MARMDATTVGEIYNKITPKGIEHMIIGESPTLGLMQKAPGAWKGFTGSGRELAWRLSNGVGASGDYAVAYANPGNPVYKKPLVTRGRLFAVRQLDHESWEASKDNANALVNLVKDARDSAIEELRMRASSIIQGSIGASIGQISAASNTGTATITLSDPTQIINFRGGMRLQAFTTVAGGLLSAGAVVTLTATGVNFDTGQLTATGNWTAGIAGVAAADYLVPEGDFGRVPVGMDGWNPATLPTVGGGDSWFGVDRGGSVPMCGGRWAPTSGEIDELILAASSRHRGIGGTHETAIMNPREFQKLNLIATANQRIQKNAMGSNGKPIADIAFAGIRLQGDCGPIDCFSDPFRPVGTVRLTKMASWKLWSLGEAFGLRTEGMADGGALRIAGADASYMVFGGYWQPVCERPIDNFLITLPT